MSEARDMTKDITVPVAINLDVRLVPRRILYRVEAHDGTRCGTILETLAEGTELAQYIVTDIEGEDVPAKGTFFTRREAATALLDRVLKEQPW